MKRFRRTPSQTIGPFFAYGLSAEQYGYNYNSIVRPSLLVEGLDGERIALKGQVLDGQGIPVSDALLEIWQADGRGAYPLRIDPAQEGFSGFARCGTGTQNDHRFQFLSIKPAASSKGWAPFVNLYLFMRGSLRMLYTRIYFSDEAEKNAKDPFWELVPPARRQTLIAQRHEGEEITEYLWDIQLQGAQETVFFDL